MIRFRKRMGPDPYGGKRTLALSVGDHPAINYPCCEANALDRRCHHWFIVTAWFETRRAKHVFVNMQFGRWRWADFVRVLPGKPMARDPQSGEVA